MKKETMAASESTKKRIYLGILFDAVGMLSLRCLCLASFQMSFGHRWQHLDDQNV
jgi:hypothetical protein